MKRALIFGIIVGCIWLMYQFPHVMINPGELVKGHQKLNNKCLSCHEPFWGISSEKCISCHTLSDIGKNSKHPNNAILFHQNLKNQACVSCHNDHKGIKPASSLGKFNHTLLSETDKTRCNDCHNKPTDNLHKQLSTNCNSCHNENGWKTSVVFNHDMVQGIDKNNCTTCHQKPKDTYHQFLNDNCSKCHSITKWVPSTFNHSAYFHLDQNHNVKCATCHTTNNYSTYTCYSCHEHSQTNLLEEHNEKGISNFNNCISCHKSANEHDIRMNGNSGGELNQKESDKVQEFIKSGEKNHKKDKEEEND